MRKLTRIAIAAFVAAAFAVAGVASAATSGAPAAGDRITAEPTGPWGTTGEGTSWPWG